MLAAMVTLAQRLLLTTQGVRRHLSSMTRDHSLPGYIKWRHKSILIRI